MCSGKPEHSYHLHYCHIHFILVFWNCIQTKGWLYITSFWKTGDCSGSFNMDIKTSQSVAKTDASEGGWLASRSSWGSNKSWRRANRVVTIKSYHCKCLSCNLTFRKLRSWHLVPSLNGKCGETVMDFILGGSKITEDGDCSHEIKNGCSLKENLWPS